MRTWFLPALALVVAGVAAVRETVLWPLAMATEDWPTAERIARDRLAARRAWLGDDAWWTGRGWYVLAWIVEESDPRASIRLADEARRVFAATGDPGRVANAYELRGVARQHLGDLDGAEADHRAALAIREVVDPWSEAVARSHTNLAIVERLHGHDDEVEQRLRAADAIRRSAGR